MRASGDDTPRETPAAKGSDSRISVSAPAWESPEPPSSTPNPAWMNETTRREPRMGDASMIREQGARSRVVRVKVHGAVAAVFVLSLAALVLGTLVMVFVFAVGVGFAVALGVALAAFVLVGGRLAVRRLRGRE